MAFVDKGRYTGRVTRAKLTESQKGTPGFEILIECEEGAMTHTIWITAKNIDRAVKDFAVFDVSEEMLDSETFLRDVLPEKIIGKLVTFGTKEETYQDKTSIKCAWINKGRDASESLEASVAGIFRAAKKAENADFEDGDIPF